MSWLVYAFLSALFAALTAILVKIGAAHVDSNLATAIRTVVILFFSWGIVLFQGLGKKLHSLSPRSLFFLVLSGLATALSWLFYFHALKIGRVSQVAPVDKLSLALTIVLAVLVLGEKITPLVFWGVVLMTIGAVMVVGGK